MLTIEKFYFDAHEALDCLHVSSDGKDCMITLVGTNGDPVQMQITVRGKQEFKQFIKVLAALAEPHCK